MEITVSNIFFRASCLFQSKRLRNERSWALILHPMTPPLLTEALYIPYPIKLGYNQQSFIFLYWNFLGWNHTLYEHKAVIEL